MGAPAAPSGRDDARTGAGLPSPTDPMSRLVTTLATTLARTATAAALLAGCRADESTLAPRPLATAASAARAAQAATSLTAELQDAAGAAIGTARLTEDAAGAVHLTVQVRGATPGLHGLHLHAVGSCVAPAFASAGGHYNPSAREHGHLNPAGFHAGDLPNVEVTPAGVGHVSVSLAQFTLAALRDADGTALVLHASEDDRRTNAGPQGPGNSGARIACGVLGAE